jgi:hypothetical protein
MTTEDFWEIGASGRRYSRVAVLDALQERHAAAHADVWKTMDFACRKLASGVYLLTYTLLQDKSRWMRRSTVWQQTSDGWKIVFHQGTIVQDVVHNDVQDDVQNDVQDNIQSDGRGSRSLLPGR